MKVHVVERDFGRTVDLYFVSEGPGILRIVYPSGVDDQGVLWWKDEVVTDRGNAPRPTFTLTREMYEAFRESFSSPVKVDQVMIDRLRKEEERVDKMMDWMMGP